MSDASGARLTGKILLVDDDLALREMTGVQLRALGHEVDDVTTLEQARSMVRSRPYDIVLSDLMLENGTGIDLLDEIRQADIRCEVIIMTGYGGVEAAVEATRRGAYDFLKKPIDATRLELEIGKALRKRKLEADIERLASAGSHGFGEIPAVSSAMTDVVAIYERAAACDSNVLLLGESGTGKEVAARAIHEHSARAAGPFVAVHCGALPPNMWESELFGHARGGFTGATRDRKGMFLAAHGGTIFLDEIGTAPADLQAGLLRVLEERTVRPVGADKHIQVDVRLIAATNADLEAEMEQRRFRSDLYFRLATLVACIPPLRERRADIPSLVHALLARIGERSQRNLTVSPRAMQRLVQHSWPGNVRELNHLLERAAITSGTSLIRASDLDLSAETAQVPTLAELERDHVQRVLEMCAGNKQKAARMLGIPRPTLYRKIERYGLEPDAADPAPAGSEPPAVSGTRRDSAPN